MRNYPSVGIQVADILLPNASIDLSKWATIACDQFTSQPQYWQQVADIVADSPSTYHLILPEVYLNSPEETKRLQSTQAAMREYLDKRIFETHTGMILVERSVAGKTRHGLMLALDLEKYDFTAGSQSLIRATEGTILDRLPPRIRIREGAPLEIPHILVLIDDPKQTVIEPVVQALANKPTLYDVELMLGSGHLTGRLVDDLALETQIVAGLERLASPEVFYPKYQVDSGKGVLLFAVGDGNHSLATAKSIWEKIKPSVGMDHPARYALVEIENVHDAGLVFEPIHRVLFAVNEPPQKALRDYFGERVNLIVCQTSEEMVHAVDQAADASIQRFGLVTPQGFTVVEITAPTSNLAVGTLQAFLDDWLLRKGAGQIDYVHGEEVLIDLSQQAGQCGFYLPAMDKNQLFETVILDGALPRKTFSMGEAVEKRFYMEARKIIVD